MLTKRVRGRSAAVARLPQPPHLFRGYASPVRLSDVVRSPSPLSPPTPSSQSRCSRQRLPNGRMLRFEVRFGSQAQEFSAVSGGRQHGGIVQVNIDNLNGRAVILA